MTAMPEAKLAREAELPYALVAMVTDYDCWRQEEAGVEIADVLKVLHNNADRAQRLVLEFAARLPKRRTPSPIDTCLDEARSEEHTSELQSIMRIPYAVFCLEKTN